MGEYQEEVLIDILDLQAELRGGEPAQRADADHAHQEEALAVTDGDLTVSVLSPAEETAALDRLAALEGRLVKLESHLAGMKERIARIDLAPEMQATSAPDTDGEAGSGSFLDLQKIVADRLDSR
jgi:hypothetical protein